TVLVRIRSRERAPAAQFRTQLEEQVGRGDPAQLHAVVVEAAAEERLVHERRVLEVPSVRVDLILVADRRQETAALDGEALTQPERLEERLLHFDRVFRRERRDKLAAKVRVDVRGHEELRLAEAEAAPRRSDFSCRRREAGDAIGVRIERAAGRGGAAGGTGGGLRRAGRERCSWVRPRRRPPAGVRGAGCFAPVLAALPPRRPPRPPPPPPPPPPRPPPCHRPARPANTAVYF